MTVDDHGTGDMKQEASEALGMLAAASQKAAARVDPKLLRLAQVRASQINGCAFCLDMHTTEALAGGETERRLMLLPGWRDSPLFSARERAVLAWTEQLTRMSDAAGRETQVTSLKQLFAEEEIANLTVGIAITNAWNRIAGASASGAEFVSKR